MSGSGERLFWSSADGVGTIRLNRAEQRNALDSLTWHEMGQALDEFGADDEVRCVLLGAEGVVFSAGRDVKEPAPTPADEERRAGVAQAGLARVRDFPKPTIAVIGGACIGGGMTLAAACDVRIASDTAFFSVPVLARGFSYGLDLTRRLAGLAPNLAGFMLLSGRRIPAGQALAGGLVDLVCPAAEVEAEGLAFAQDVARAPLPALLELKATLVAAGR